MKYLTRIYLCIITFVMFSCGLSPLENVIEDIKTEEMEIQEDSSLFIENTEKQNIVFETNDSKYLKSTGFTLWTVPNINEEETFIPLSVQVYKQSGRAEAGYGIVFCEQEIKDKNFLLTILININGLYTVGKVSDGVFTHINGGWKNSTYINKGMGVSNRISVSYEKDTKSFQLKINDYEITTFTVSEEIEFKGSKYGYVAVVSNKENFPTDTVRVIFKNE